MSLDACPIELIYKILQYLPYKDVVSYCGTNVENNAICRDTRFWIEKIDNDFKNCRSKNPSYYIEKYQYGSFGIDIYKRWRDRREVRLSIERMYNDIFFWMMDMCYPNIHYRQYVDDIAAQYGNMVILISFGEKNIFPSIGDGVRLATVNGHIEVLEWLESKGIFPNIDDVNCVAQKGSINTLQWLELRGILPDKYGVNWAAGCGRIDMLQWLESRGILPDRDGARSAGQHSHIHILEWLYNRRIIPTHDGAKFITLYCNVEVLEWLEKKNIFMGCTMDQESVDFIAEDTKNADVLRWLEKRNVIPSTHIKKKSYSTE